MVLKVLRVFQEGLDILGRKVYLAIQEGQGQEVFFTHILFYLFIILSTFFLTFSCTSCAFCQVHLGPRAVEVSLAFQVREDRMVNRVFLDLQVDQERKVSRSKSIVFFYIYSQDVILACYFLLKMCLYGSYVCLCHYSHKLRNWLGFESNNQHNFKTL